MEGLTFHYMAGGNAQDNACRLNILLPQHGFSLRDIPFQVISDEQIDDTASDGAPVRRCEIAFGELTDAQRVQLQHFIEHHTEAAVED